MTHLGGLIIAFALGGLSSGAMGYHAGLTDGARKMLAQIKREARRASR